MKPLRTTKHFSAFPAKRQGFVTIRANDPGQRPRQKTINPRTWAQLNAYGNETFDASCIWDLCLATTEKP